MKKLILANIGYLLLVNYKYYGCYQMILANSKVQNLKFDTV